MKPFLSPIVLLVALLFANGAEAADLLELLSGAKLEGRVIKIDKEAKKVTFEGMIAGKTLERVFAYSQIHAVTFNGKRYELTPKPAPGTKPERPTGKPATSGNDSGNRSSSEVEKLIQAGATPPDWLEATPLEYPKTLDLSWPEKPNGGWNNQLNVGQYYWDVINPNPSRWRSGVRFAHHLLDVHKDNAATRQRVMSHLAIMYFSLFQDYARAAYWWKQTGMRDGSGQELALAECYYRLGSRPMAEKLIVDPDKRGDVMIHPGMIKLWGDMGEPVKAAKLAEMCNQPNVPMHLPYLFAGDAFRTAGNSAKAADYYQKVLNAPDGANKGAANKIKARAQASLDAIRLFGQLDVAKIGDGSYRGSSLGFEGPVEVEVTVADRKITVVRVVNHKEKQFYSSMEDVPRQIIAKNGVKGIDATSRATITGEAIINATAKALSSGMK